jgi:hypothetical protein
MRPDIILIMKKKQIWKIFCRLIIFTLVLYSCETILDVPPEDVLEEHEAFTDEFSARSSVLGVYALLQDVAEQLIILGELQGDLLTVTENAGEDLIQVNEHNVDVNNVYADPTNFFKIIVNCNEVIHKLHRVMESDLTFSQRDLNSHLAELILIRAWCYFKMIQIYGQVPYFEEPISDYQESFRLNEKLNTLQTEDFVLDTILKQIIAIDTFDLNMEEDAPYYALRVSKFTNWALQGEIYLWRNNYVWARRAYYKVINIIATLGFAGTERLPWINNWRYNYTEWKNMFRFDYGSSDFETEVMFVIPFSKFYNQQHNLQRMFACGEGGNYLLKPTKYIMDLFEKQKIVKWELQTEHEAGTPGDLNRGKGVSYDSINGCPVVTKYSIFKEPFDDDAGIIIYRAGDYHLGCCEAVNRIGQTTNAVDHLNQGLLYSSAWGIGTRSRVNINLVSVKDPLDKNEVEDVILSEKALEMAFEGHRWFDLVRIARHRDDPSFLADKIAEKFNDPLKKEEVRTVLMDTTRWFLPLRF